MTVLSGSRSNDASYPRDNELVSISLRNNKKYIQRRLDEICIIKTSFRHTGVFCNINLQPMTIIHRVAYNIKFKKNKVCSER